VQARGVEARAQRVGVRIALRSGIHPAQHARQRIDPARGARPRAAVVQAGAQQQPRARHEHRDRGIEDAVLRLRRHELQDIEQGDAAAVRGQARGQVDAVETDIGQPGVAGRALRLRDLAGVVVDAAVGQRDPGRAQRMREQADAAAQVEQRRVAAAQRIDHARIQRIAAQLGARVVVVGAVAVPAVRQEMAGDAQRSVAVERPAGDGDRRRRHRGASNRRATGSARRVQSA
jgi:hypothetical protein